MRLSGKPRAKNTNKSSSICCLLSSLDSRDAEKIAQHPNALQIILKIENKSSAVAVVIFISRSSHSNSDHLHIIILTRLPKRIAELASDDVTSGRGLVEANQAPISYRNTWMSNLQCKEKRGLASVCGLIEMETDWMEEWLVPCVRRKAARTHVMWFPEPQSPAWLAFQLKCKSAVSSSPPGQSSHTYIVCILCRETRERRIGKKNLHLLGFDALFGASNQTNGWRRRKFASWFLLSVESLKSHNIYTQQRRWACRVCLWHTKEKDWTISMLCEGKKWSLR